MKSNTNIGLGIITLAILGAIIWALFYEIGQAPWQFITILIALLGTLITFSGNLLIQIRNEQKPKKIEIYDKIIKFFFDSIFSSKLGQQPKTEEELIQGFADMTPDLILWASDDVLNVYTQLRQIINNNMQDSLNNTIPLFGQLLLAMRKDLGHQNKQINEVVILNTFLNDAGNFFK